MHEHRMKAWQCHPAEIPTNFSSVGSSQGPAVHANAKQPDSTRPARSGTLEAYEGGVSGQEGTADHPNIQSTWTSMAMLLGYFPILMSYCC